MGGVVGGVDGQTVLVTGAAGRIGTAVCARLTASGARVRALVLPAEPIDGAGPEAVEIVEADARSVDDVGRAVAGCTAVVHLAALISPHVAPAHEVFGTNVTATFTVLDRSGAAGIRRAVIASSINANGLPFNSHPVKPAYWPIDETLPIDLDDAYSLSKQTDEHTARMFARHWSATVVALRFPFTAAATDLRRHSEQNTADPADGMREGWSYLDVRDAALAVELALTRPGTGAQSILVAADQTQIPFPTEDLLDAYAAGVPRTRPFVGREVPIDLTRARTLLGFRAQHPLDLPSRPLRGVLG